MVVGVDLGGTKCLALALDEGAAVVAEHRIPTPGEPPALLGELAELVARVRAEAAESAGDRVEAVGIGAPGLVDRGGRLRYAPNLPGVEELELATGLERALGLPVRADNDATCATWGERQCGAGQGLDDLVMVTLGTGIGGGIVADGGIYRGANGFAGEVGHMVVDPGGPACGCGQRGCWEQLASGRALGRLAREAAVAGQGRRMVELAGGRPDEVRGEHASAAALEGDDEAQTVMDRLAWWVALGLANLANVFDPEAFVVGGGLVRAGDALLEPTRRAFAGLVEAARHRPPISIVPAVLGERAGAIGAAWLARGQ